MLGHKVFTYLINNLLEGFFCFVFFPVGVFVEDEYGGLCDLWFWNSLTPPLFSSAQDIFWTSG